MRQKLANKLFGGANEARTQANPTERSSFFRSVWGYKDVNKAKMTGSVSEMNYSNVRARQNSDGFCELSNDEHPAEEQQQEENKVEAKPQLAAENAPSNQS